MLTTELAANPFALMINPEALMKAIEASDRLGRLQSRICRPLDKPLLPQNGDGTVADFDQDVDASADESGAD